MPSLAVWGGEKTINSTFAYNFPFLDESCLRAEEGDILGLEGVSVHQQEHRPQGSGHPAPARGEAALPR